MFSNASVKRSSRGKHTGVKQEKKTIFVGLTSDKDTLIKLVRDAPSQEAFVEIDAKLLNLTKQLFVRPGQVIKPVSFHDYYEINWRNFSSG